MPACAGHCSAMTAFIVGQSYANHRNWLDFAQSKGYIPARESTRKVRLTGNTATANPAGKTPGFRIASTADDTGRGRATRAVSQRMTG